MIERVHFLVSGQVQGVGFRQASQARALDLGLCGWVRNLADGRVEGVAIGTANALNAFEQWLQHGPQHASVSALHWSATTPAANLTVEQGFSIRPTAEAPEG